MVGEISQMKEQAKRMQKQLDTDYKNIHGEYIDCLVKWKVRYCAGRQIIALTSRVRRLETWPTETWKSTRKPWTSKFNVL
jgi:hypothetical protein